MKQSEFIGCSSMNIFVVASDPGSANAIMPVIIACLRAGHRINGVVSGSAITMLDKWHEILKIDDVTPIDEILHILGDKEPQVVLAGAGAFNLLEHTVRRAALDLEIPCVAVLDHWTNYQQRFRRFDGTQWIYSLPDRICVLDETVRNEMLIEGFEPEQIVVTGQPHFEYIANWKNALSTTDVTRFRSRFVKNEATVLIGFCSEPLAEDLKITHTEDPGYTQYTTIAKIASVLGRHSKLSGRHIHFVVRPHPRENVDKIENVLSQVELPLSLSWDVSKIGSSLEFVVSCDLLIGMTSMALIEAYIISQQVLSVQLGLKKTDVFFGTTRGYCPSIYDIQELDEWLGKWFKNDTRSKNAILHTWDAAEHIITVMEELVRDKENLNKLNEA